MENAVPDKLQEIPSDHDLMLRLRSLLGPDYLELLLTLLDKINEESGYGGIEIVIAGGRAQSMKLIASYRPPGKQPLGEL